LLIVLITSFIGWAGLARVIRGQVLSIKERNLSKQHKQWAATVCHPSPRFAADS